MKKYLKKGKYWDKLTPEERNACTNGLGPEWFPDALRYLLSYLLAIFADAVKIHDIWYEYGTSTDDKITADKDFLHNLRKICWHEIIAGNWFNFNLWRKFLRHRGYSRILYAFVRYGGNSAFWNDKKLKKLGLSEPHEKS